MKKINILTGIMLLVLMLCLFTLVLAFSKAGFSLHKGSCSMAHPEGWTTEVFESRYNITQEQFNDFPNHDGFTKAIPLVYSINIKNAKVGDIVMFNSNNGIITHRVVEIKEDTIRTVGDNNDQSFDFEKFISQEDYIGKVFIISLDWLISSKCKLKTTECEPDDCNLNKVSDKFDFCMWAILSSEERTKCYDEAEEYKVYCNKIKDETKKMVCEGLE